MKAKIIYMYHLCKFVLRSIYNRMMVKFKIKVKITPKYHTPLLEANVGNQKIKEMILSGKPFAVGRFGSNELNAITSVEGEKLGILHVTDNLQDRITNCAGVFPNDKKITRQFAEYMLSVVEEIDFLGCWNDRMEDYVVKKYMKNTILAPLKSIEPYYFSEPWSEALAGKKVLVIHPFEKSIQKQMKHREKIFKGEVLPPFELYTLKAVQTIAGTKDERFSTWFDALEYMYQSALEIDFDIAILGCGAYGLPLAVKLKKAGKQAIHMGGSLQILFGIKGKRWDSNPNVNKFYNEYWIRPNGDEVPEKNKIVENGCYW